MKRERGLFFLVPEGRFSGGQEGDSWWDENRFCKNRPGIYAGSKQIPLFFGNGLATFLQYPLNKIIFL